ncbi:riboflavin kinase [Coemansia spiralis]|uniref:Riboflavin kinase n=2 Tax=Coemansia TaxID=4863 RepID=A0A9W8FZC6_9FUNG|nr:riboflavin kinase [Coemansia umbellata]KAJ2620193.1 riboflavin kinase [Coemansia sp. RSA 1358]KAJ2672653.1 riboflavin kinase [Coemansia spiralis]
MSEQQQAATEAVAQASGRPLVAGPEEVLAPFPVVVEGSVVAGFGRGGKQLGIPTANLAEPAVEQLALPVGVYLGWAQVAGDAVRPMVMSLGWNPFFKNEKLSAEVHIIHRFASDFYGRKMRVAILAFIRNEKDYASLDALIQDIQIDIHVALKSLQRPAYAHVRDSAF